MRMAELSKTSGVSIPTIKYYLREGLLPAGEHTKTNQANYSDHHLMRLKLIGVMSGVARLSLAEIKVVLNELDGPGSVLDSMAVMQSALVGRPTHEARTHSEESQRILDQIIEDRGWQVNRETGAYPAAVNAIANLHTTDLNWTGETLGEYAKHAEVIGGLDVGSLDLEGPSETLLVQMIEGTLLRRQLLDALTLLAQQHTSRVRMAENGAE